MNRTLLTAIVIIVIITIASIVFYESYSSNQGTIKVRVTTTTSLYATGLLDFLGEKFQESHPGVTLEFIPVGSGRALAMAAAGDACFVLVHAPNLEIKYINQGVLEYHKIFAYNYFVIVGPSSDPAGVRDAKDTIDAMRRIYVAGERGEAIFLSRGDKSGTNERELLLWNKTGLNPIGKKWYYETGQGMGQTLVMASEKKAYTLSDIGTFLRFKKEGRIPGLELLYGNDTALINVYSAYIVKSCNGVEREMAKEFIDFITSSKGQSLIGDYGLSEYGSHLFYPAAGKVPMLKMAWNDLTKQG